MTITADPEAQRVYQDREARLRLVTVAALVGVAAAIVFVGWPELDLVVSRLFNQGPRNFVFNHSVLAAALRFSFKLLTWTASVATVLGIVLALARGRRLFGVELKQWVFLALVLITGPGLIANTLFKDNWARPRPLYVVDFGGPDQFTPVLARSGTCEKNCSFISGEASSIFALGFALAMLARRRRAAWMAGAVAAGSAIGLIRLGEGGHFLSDVIFAGTLMALDVALMHWLVFDVVSPRVPAEAWWHEKAVATWHTLRTKAEAAWGALRTKLETFYAELRKRRKAGSEDGPIGPAE
jgi:lipid A 4'-phosphatase